MSSYIYKNLLIIERGSPHSAYIKNMNIPFEDESTPFIYKNSLDKIIFCFDYLIQVSNDIKILEATYNFDSLKYEYSNNALIGIIKVSSDRNNLKIYHAGIFAIMETDYYKHNHVITYDGRFIEFHEFTKFIKFY